MHFTHRLSLEHGIERGNFIDSHWGNFQNSSNFIHNSNGAVSKLTLTKIEEGHDGSLLVVRRILGNGFINFGLVLSIEGKFGIGIVGGCVTVHALNVMMSLDGSREDGSRCCGGAKWGCAWKGVESSKHNGHV